MHAVAHNMMLPLRAIHVYSVACIIGCGCMGFVAVASILSRQNTDSFFVIYAIALGCVFVVLCAITSVYLLDFRKTHRLSTPQVPSVLLDDCGTKATASTDAQTCCICLCDIQPLEEYRKMHCCSGGMHDACLRQYTHSQATRGLPNIACPLCRSAVVA